MLGHKKSRLGEAAGKGLQRGYQQGYEMGFQAGKREYEAAVDRMAEQNRVLRAENRILKDSYDRQAEQLEACRGLLKEHGIEQG